MSCDEPRQLQLVAAPQTQLTSDDYYTPRSVFAALGLRFDLDVCAPAGGVPWVPADRYYTIADDGLAQPWFGRVWMNPPFSKPAPWVRRFIDHRHGVALLPHAKAAWHPIIWATVDAVVVPDDGLLADKFVGGRPASSVWLAAFGPECAAAIANLGLPR